jgi:hypothetical protein
VEGPAVSVSVLGCPYLNRGVIPTEAKRSGGTCC